MPGIGRRTAEAIVAALAAGVGSREPAVNVTTGEVLEIERRSTPVPAAGLMAAIRTAGDRAATDR